MAIPVGEYPYNGGKMRDPEASGLSVEAGPSGDVTVTRDDNTFVVDVATTGTASGSNAFAEGSLTQAQGHSSHAEGDGTRAFSSTSHAEGRETQAGSSTHSNDADAAHAEGFQTKAFAYCSHTEGYRTRADDSGDNTGTGAHAEGYETKSTATGAHAEGYGTVASSTDAHAEGMNTRASGQHSHAAGFETVASGDASHSEGSGTLNSAGTHSTCEASGYASHAEGCSKSAGARSHSEGNETEANGFASHSWGNRTIANKAYQTVFGVYNEEEVFTDENDMGDYAEIVGGGTDFDDRKNIRTLDWDGNETIAGKHYGNGNPVSIEDQLAGVTPSVYEDITDDFMLGYNFSAPSTYGEENLKILWNDGLKILKVTGRLMYDSLQGHIPINQYTEILTYIGDDLDLSVLPVFKFMPAINDSGVVTEDMISLRRVQSGFHIKPVTGVTNAQGIMLDFICVLEQQS